MVNIWKNKEINLDDIREMTKKYNCSNKVYHTCDPVIVVKIVLLQDLYGI